MSSIGIFCLIILVPIIPAYLLYRALPSSADVTGRLQGMQIKLGGAFAGYFALMLLIMCKPTVFMPPAPYQVWEVSGHLLDQNGQPIQPLDPSDLQLSPASMDLDRSGGFVLRYYSWPDPDGEHAYPGLIVSHNGYQQVVFSLDPADPSLKAQGKDAVNGTIINLHNVTLKPIANPYAADAPALNASNGPAPVQPAAIAAAGVHVGGQTH